MSTLPLADAKFLINDNNLLSQPRNDLKSHDLMKEIGYQNTNHSETLVNVRNYFNSVQSMSHENSVAKYIKAAVADNTRRGYQSDLAHFINWGGYIPSTPQAVSEYLAAHAETLSISTLNRRVVAISRAHTSNNILSPTKSDIVKTTLRGIKRTFGTKQRQVSPVLTKDIFEMWQDFKGIKGIRDRALLLIGFAGAFRRSELVALDISDLDFVEQGLIITLRKSKTDQEAEGRKIAIPFGRFAACPVKSLQEWLLVGNITEGPIFRAVNRHSKVEDKALSAQAVAIIVKARVAAIGLDAQKFSGHSLRVGLVTSAAQAGVSVWKIKQQTGHRSDAMLARYIRDANIFNDNAAGALL